LATLLAGAVLWIGGLKFAPGLHEHIHDDAQQENHHCVVKVFSDGVLTGEVTVGVEAPAVLITSQDRVAPEFHVESTPWRMPPGRAPPLD
jgi:hypothetical protein